MICSVTLLASALSVHAEEGREPSIQEHTPWLEGENLTGDWLGTRPQLENAGFTFEGFLIFDYTVNLAGGADTQGEALRYLFDLYFFFDTQKMLGWEGGLFSVTFQHQNGQSASDEVGDVMGLSGYDADGRTQLDELWYQQLFFEELFRLKAGKIDANLEFGLPLYAGEFIHGASPTTVTNPLLPTYPDAATGVVLWVQPPIGGLSFGVGWFDGALGEGVTTGDQGPKTFFEDSPSDWYLIGEVRYAYTLADHLSGRIALGAWGHTGDLPAFDGSTSDGTAGIYAILDQTLLKEDPQGEDDAQGLTLFVHLGHTDDDELSSVWFHAAAGLVWTGPIPSRDDDAIGFAINHGELSDAPGSGFTDNEELAYELFYKLQLTPFFVIKPDVQWIVNPGGAGADDALAVTLQVEVSF